jgi:C-methyltransferase C-terminal domain/Putative zinc binding domain/Methyltransferase domain
MPTSSVCPQDVELATHATHATHNKYPLCEEDGLMYWKIDKCRICGNRELVEVLDLGIQVLTGVFPRTREEKLTAGPLKLVKCMGGAETCGLLQLQHSYDLGEMYGLNYGYRSGLNSSMVAHLQEKVRRILERATPAKDSLMIDIGSNDSTTLQAYPREYTLVGIDPTGVKFKDYYPPHIHLIPDFFSAARVRAEFGARRAAVITSFSMFYDLEDPIAFMREVAEVLDDEGIWVFEQSYLATMLERNSYDTVCHEHLEYYLLKQIIWMAERAGLRILDVELNDVNGGSFSIVAARKGSAHRESPSVASLLARELELGLDTLVPYREFEKRVQASRQDLVSFLERARTEGRKVCALGASTKGNVLLQYCGVTAEQISLVGEVNIEKFGCFTPGTLLPIVPQEQLLAQKPDLLLVLPWHFREFFLSNRKFAGTQLLFPLPTLEIVAGGNHMPP